MSLYTVPPSPSTSYTLCHRLHAGHQQKLDQCPNRTHPRLVLLSFMIFTMSSSDESTVAPTVGIIDASTSARAKPSKSDSLLVSLKSASRTAAAARDSSSSGGSAATSGYFRGCCWAITSATTRWSSSIKSLQFITIPSRSSTSPPVFAESAILFRF